jgi:hypothetical protein
LAITFVKAKITFCLSGELAQFRQLKERDPIGATDDQGMINSLLFSLYPFPPTDLFQTDGLAYDVQYAECKAQHEKLAATLSEDTEQLISFGWIAIDSTAQKLIEKLILTGSEIEQIILETLPPKSEWPDLKWLDTLDPGELFYSEQLKS